MSTALQGPDPEPNRAPRMSVALIGPDNARRSVVAKAVSVSEDRSVQEFGAYPAQLADLPHMLETRFDIVMIDLDSDQSYALEIVEKIAAISDVTVMVYSTRNDPSLVMRCMRAGARDFLPIPADAVRDAEKGTEAGPEQAAPPRAAAPRVLDKVEKQGTPETRIDDPWDLSEKRIHEVVPAPSAGEAQPRPLPRELRQSDRLPPDFKQWGTAPVRTASPAVVKPPAPTPRPATVSQPPAASKAPDVAARSAAAPQPPAIFANPPLQTLRPAVTPQAQPTIAARVAPAPARIAVSPEPPVRKPSEPIQASGSVTGATATTALPVGGIESDADVLALFRHGHREDLGHDEEGENRKVNWKKWALIAAGPVVLGLVVLLIFLRPSKPDTPVVHPAETVAPVADNTAPTPEPVPASQLTKPVAKPSPLAQATVASTPAPAPEQPAPVSSDLMNAQLTAPSKISKDVKRTPPPVEVPATGLAPISMDDGTVVPGPVFGNGNKPKIAPVSTLSAGVATGMLIHRVEPVYPQFARDNHLGGTVVLRAKITKAGTIGDLHVVSGPKIFYPVAMDAVKNWKYKPYMLNNQPVEVETTISLIFSLGQH